MAIKQSVLGEPEATGARNYERVTVMEAAQGWSALRLHELWEYRDLLYLMTWRDIQTRYRQMALGPLWIIIQPVVNMVLYSIIFGEIAKLPSEGQPYALFTFVALLPWNVFTDAVNAAANSLLGSKTLLAKIYFPRLLAPISRCLSSLADFGIAFTILIVLFAVYGQWPTARIIFVPVFLLWAVLTGLAFGIWFAGAIVHYRDFGQVLGIVLRLWMYGTPVVYSLTLVPERWRTLYRLNPMTGVVEGFRWALLGTGQGPDGTMLVSVVITLIILVAGLYYFKRAERNIVDIL